jgi:hypothetical protein
MSTAEAIAEAIRALVSAAPESAVALGDEQLCSRADQVERLGRLVDALRVEVAVELDARSRFDSMEQLARRHGAAGGVYLLEFITRVSQREAARRVRVGRGVASEISLSGEVLPAAFPIVAEAVQRGELGMDAAAAIIRHLTEAGRTASIPQLRDAEAHLVDAARSTCADLVAVQARGLAVALDPDGVEPREEVQRRRRRFVLGREADDGMTPFHGLADPVDAALLRAALSERTAPTRQPRFVDPDDPAVTASDDGGLRDERSREQRNFDVLLGLLTAGVRADNAIVGSLHGTATVTAVVRLDDLARGTGAAWLDDTQEPVSIATARELACDGGLRRIIVDAAGEPLWEGRRERYFTPAQRRALAVRDGGCVWPRCTAPPSWCHAHHVLEWENGGPTDVDNGVLLCSFHHHLLHAGEFRMRMIGALPHLLSPPWIDPDQQWRHVTKSRLGVAA